MGTPTFLSSNDIRKRFLNYFARLNHQVVPSSSLVPTNDPTLLFTNAGMVQFKEVFLGVEKCDYSRATTAQRCVRAGGKHNDLERVGFTARHHTFFEMLGNFSFGDYFKREAIRFAYDFLVKELQLPKEKLWITVFETDQEAENIWLNEIGIDPSRFSRCGEQDNFWSMGPTGPCGPCTEIFYDHGADVPGGPPGSADADGDRYIEVWNLVFMQYNRENDGTLTPLPKPSVDTGMGLERIAAIMQGVKNNYQTDLFTPLIKQAEILSHLDAKTLQHTPEKLFSLRVIADHIRSSSFLIADQVLPSNEGRGYVLRRIMRRALRHGHKLGMTEPFFYKLVSTLTQQMGEAYPILKEKHEQIAKVIEREEIQFSTTLTQGLKLFEEVIVELKTAVIPGEIVFKLYDTYGFPVDLTADIARERSLIIDYDGFEEAMKQQRERSREASKFTAEYTVMNIDDSPTRFMGHETERENMSMSKVTALYREGKFVDQLNAGEKGSVVLNQTPFYAESGGQVGDQGIISAPQQGLFKVLDTIKQGQTHLHLGKLEKGILRVGDEITAAIDEKRRAKIVLNHTATHLLHLILKEVLGSHAEQKGSLVAPEKLRFDFAHHSPLSQEELKLVEKRVNEEIRANYAAEVEVTTPEAALASGAVGLFGEKYGSKVRVVHFGPSVELCGGTHAKYTGEIGFFKIVLETGIAQGIRRIEAVTGEGALLYIDQEAKHHEQLMQQSRTRIEILEKEVELLKNKLAANMSHELIHQAKEVGQFKILATIVEGLDGKALRQTMDHLKKGLGSAIIVLATVKDKKIGLLGGVTADLVDNFNAKDIINHIAKQVGGKGGGRADLAEAGGNQPEHLASALNSIYTLVEK